MPHRAEQSLAVCVSLRNKMSCLCLVSRAIMSTLYGLCLPIFCVFCVTRIIFVSEYGGVLI
jgi:hypothetical protein